MIRKLLFIGIALFVFDSTVFAQAIPARAYTNVIITHHDGETERGHIVWRGNKIEAVGSGITIPFDAKVIDGGDSLYVYPGFIDGLSHIGSPDVPSNLPRVDNPGKPGNERAGIQPQRKPSDHLEDSNNPYEGWKKSGFSSSAIALKGFMLPGQVEFFSLQGSNTINHVISSNVGIFSQFEISQGVYPSTLMGIMAQFRQLWYDAQAHKEHKRLYASNAQMYEIPEHKPVLDAFIPVIRREQPVFFLVDTKEDIERAVKLFEELNFKLIIVSGKEAWRTADVLQSKNIPVLASFDIPGKPDWMKDEEADEEISEEEQNFRERQELAWNQATTNVFNLLQSGVTVGFASAGMSAGDFIDNVQLMHEQGLSKNQILRILTENTATVLNQSSNYGRIGAGYAANFSVWAKSILEEDSSPMALISNGILNEF